MLLFQANYHQRIGFSSIYLSVQNLLEYMVRFRKYYDLWSNQNVHASMDVKYYCGKMYSSDCIISN